VVVFFIIIKFTVYAENTFSAWSVGSHNFLAPFQNLKHELIPDAVPRIIILWNISSYSRVSEDRWKMGLFRKMTPFLA
jgi:hypothetical protein